MGGDFSVNPGQFGFSREDPSRNLGLSYGSFGPWAGAVMQGLGMMPTGPLSALSVPASLAYNGLTGKSVGLAGLLGNSMNPTQRTGLTPEEMMAGKAGGMGGGGLLDMLGGWSGGAGNQGMNAGAMG